MTNSLQAGAACVDITPETSQFLYGYPHVKRYSTGIHDPLFSSALCLSDGHTRVLFIANDIIFITKDMAERTRSRISASTGIPPANILVSATHTHSGPITVRYLSNEADPAVPEPDPTYLRRLEEGIVAAGQQAVENTMDAEVAVVIADGSCVGTNRRKPGDPSDPHVPVLLVRRVNAGPPIAVMLISNMHPTVLHEDSTLVSGDFPGMTRQYLQQHVLGPECVVLHHTGAAGNQSPRHVTRGNTFAEAGRLGFALGQAVEQAIANARYRSDLPLQCRRAFIESMPIRQFPSSEWATENLAKAKARLASLRESKAPRADVRTAECDWFGAEETLTLARAAASGRLDAITQLCLPAEIQFIRVGPWSFVGWPGEVFVEFALEIRKSYPNTFVITLANGELQGYQVTADAVREGGYEASNALFQSPDAGQLLVQATRRLLDHKPSQ